MFADDRIIYHIDVNSAFLSWEAVYRLKHLGGRLDLRTIPSAVGGDPQMRHGIILAKSIPAKKFNIHTGESTMAARQKCPDIVLVPPNYTLYQQCSKAFMDILREYTPTVEQYSIDEAFMDMSGTEKLWGEPVEIANQIRERIYNELGFTVNIGVSNNKLLAKMASDFKKPNLVHSLFPCEIQKKMWPLPVEDLFFVGRASSKKLKNLGVNTIGDLANTDIGILKAHFKSYGEVIHALANGIDTSDVLSTPPEQKGYGNSTTTPYDIVEIMDAKKTLLALSETVGARLRKDNMEAAVISVGVKDWEFHSVSHQMALDNPTNITEEIFESACKLLEEFWDGIPLRHLGIHTSKVTPANAYRQANLFESKDYQKLQRLNQTLDAVRKRFGNDSIFRAAFLTGRIDHMSGGISRERRNVDYSQLEIK